MVDTRRTLAFGGLLLLVALTGCSYIVVEEPVCHACERGMEGAETANVTVESSSLQVEFREDGSGRWTVTSEVTGAGLERLQDNETAVRRLAEESVQNPVYPEYSTRYEPIHGGDVSNLTATLENGTLVVRFTVENAGKGAVGDTLLVGYLHTNGEYPRNHPLGTDEVRFRGPPGTVVSNNPPEATITNQGRTARWTGRGTRVTSHAYLTYSPDDGRAGRTTGQAAIAADVARWALPEVFHAGVGAALGLAVLLTVLWLIGYRLDGSIDPSWRDSREGNQRRFLRNLVLEAGLGAAVVVIAVLALLATHEPGTRWSGGLISLAVASVTLLFATGAAANYSRVASRAGTAFLVCSPFLVAAGYVPSIPTRPTGASTPFLALAWAVVCLLASPAFFIGWYAIRDPTE